MQHLDRTLSRIAGEIAARQHGVVTRGQLLDAGVTVGEIRQALSEGALLGEFRGVYRVGHRAPSREARYMAAVLACGEGALLSGRAAAHLWGLIKGPAPQPEVLAPTERRVAGIAVHRSRQPISPDATTHHGIPATTVPRTLVDLAAHLPPDALARAVHEAEVQHQTTPAQVNRLLARRRTAPGAGKLNEVLHGHTPVTLSALERRFLEVLQDQGLPLPQTNRPAGGRRVDCRWPAQRLTVELDSYRFHNTRHAWEQDRRREREARARGDDFRRYTYGDVFEDRRLMLDELQALLAA